MLRKLFEKKSASPEGHESRDLDPEVRMISYGETPGDIPLLQGNQASSERVTPEEALALPGVWAAVNFLSGAMAGLPIQVYSRTPGSEPVQITSGVASWISEAANEVTPSFEFREVLFSQMFHRGRGLAYIDRNKNGDAENLYWLDRNRTSVRRATNGAIFYDHRRDDGVTVSYPARDVIDLAFLRKPDFISSYDPLQVCAAAIRKGLNANRFGLNIFGRNGIAPYILTGPFSAAKAAANAARDMLKLTRAAADEGRPFVPMPAGHTVERLGGDPNKMQLTEVERLAVEQVARIYQLPPMFLQDLTHGNFANTEQQDIHLVKHTLRRFIKKAEQEMSLKIFGRGSNFFIKFNVDALLRGDFKTRMEGLATGIQNGVLTPNEARKIERRPPLPGGDNLMIQGATVPIISQTENPEGEAE